MLLVGSVLYVFDVLDSFAPVSLPSRNQYILSPLSFTFGNGTKAKREADAADGEQRSDDELKTYLRNEQAGTKHEQREIAVRLVCHASDDEEHRHPIDAKQELLAGRLSLSDVLYLMIHLPFKDIKALPPLRTLALNVRSACSVFGQWTTLTSFAQQLRSSDRPHQRGTGECCRCDAIQRLIVNVSVVFDKVKDEQGAASI